MHVLHSFLSTLLSEAALHPTLLAPTIMLGVFFLEDPTTLIVGVLAADGVIPVPLALASLYAGIIFGDIILYGIGWLASLHPRLARFVDHEFVAPFRTWLETRYMLTIFSARFIPGGRFPTYTTSGFFRSPFSLFVLIVTAAASIWTTALFAGAYWFGSVTSLWIGPVRWGVACLVILLLFLAGRHNILAYRLTRDAQDTADGTRAQ